MAPGIPEWNPQEKAASLLHLAAAINEMARMTFLKDGTHVRLAFLVGDDGEMGMAPLAGEPDAVREVLKGAVAAAKPYGVIQVAEAWTYMRRSATDHTFTQVMQGEMRVSDLSRGERTEALIVSAQSRDGASRLWVSPILRGGAAKVSLADAVELDQPGGGAGGLFA